MLTVNYEDGFVELAQFVMQAAQIPKAIYHIGVQDLCTGILRVAAESLSGDSTGKVAVLSYFCRTITSFIIKVVPPLATML
jgi:hypothetical protein